MKKIFLSVLALTIGISIFAIHLNAGMTSESEINTTGVGFSLNSDATAIFSTDGYSTLFGRNIYGNMGTGNKTAITERVNLAEIISLSSNENIVSVSPGTNHTLVVTSLGKVFAFGANFSGQLGNDTTVESLVPLNITSSFGSLGSDVIVKVQTGQSTSFALSKEGKVFSWGYNGEGTLGTGDKIDYKTPQNITANFSLNANETIVDIHSGEVASAFITSEGRLFTSGPNSGFTFNTFDPKFDSVSPIDFTPFLNLSATDKVVQVSLQTYQMMILTELGRVIVGGFSELATGIPHTPRVFPDPSQTNANVPTDLDLSFLATNEKVVDISLGVTISGLLTNLGNLYVFGFANRLGLGENNPTTQVFLPMLYESTSWRTEPDEKIIEIDSGKDHMGMITSLGRVLVWGGNSNRNIDPSTTSDVLSPLFIYQAPKIVDLQFLGFNDVEISKISIKEGASLTGINLPTPPIVEGYTFKNFDATIPSVMPVGGLIIKAVYEVNIYTITFNTNGGTAVTAITQDYNSTITLPTNPTKEGYTFGGWYVDITMTTPFTATTMPTENLTLYAKWTINTYTISFDTDGGSAVSSITQDYNTSITVPEDPTRTGYTFNGWSQVIPEVMPASNTTITARWTINTYTITFDTNGGTAVTSITQDYNSTITLPTNPIKEGHTFAGWYVDVELTEVFVFDKMPSDVETLYASWTMNSYDITIVSPISKAGLTELLPGERVIDIQYGSYAGIILTSMNRVFVTGSLQYTGFEVEGLTGDVYLDVPTLAKTDMFNEGETIVDFSYTSSAGILLTSEGRIFTFGSNAYQQIGNGDVDSNKFFKLTDITTSVTNLMDASETIVDVFNDVYLNMIVTSTNRLIAIGGVNQFQNWFGIPNVLGSPVDVSQFFDTNKRVSDILYVPSNSIFNTDQGYIYNFQLLVGNEVFVPVTLPNTQSGETISYIFDVYGNDQDLIILTSNNRIVSTKYEVTNPVFPPTREYTETYSSSALQDVLNPDEGIVSALDAVDANNEIILLTSEGRVFIITSTTTTPVVTEVTLPEMNDGEIITHLTAAFNSSYALVSNLGRAFGYGRNSVIGAGLGVPPTNFFIIFPTNPVELFKMSQALTPITFEFGETLDLDPLPNQGNLIFRGYFLDEALTIPFTSDTMPAEDVILYPKFTNLLTYDMSAVVWDYTDAFTYDGTEFEVTLDESTLPEGVTVLSYEGNKATDANTYEITVLFNYNEDTHVKPSLTLTFTINKAVFDVSNVKWEFEGPFLFDETEKQVVLEGLPAGLTATYTNQKQTNPGTYTTTVEFIYDTDNYEEVLDKTLTWTIVPTYLYRIIVDGEVISSQRGELSDTVNIVEPTKEGYIFKGFDQVVPNVFGNTDIDFTATFEPLASYDLSQVTWLHAQPFTYNGQELEILLNEASLPEGLSVLRYEGNKQTNAGSYDVKVFFNYNEDTHFEPTLTYTWAIEKAVIDMSQVAWVSEGPFLFDELEKQVILSGLPEGVTATYVNDAFTNPGTYTTTVSYNYDSNNYETLVDKTLTWTIIPTYLYRFILDGEVISSQRGEVSDTVNIVEPTKEGYIFKGFDQVVPNVFDNTDIDFTATFILLENKEDNHVLTDILNAIALDAYTGDDIKVDTEIVKTESAKLDKTLSESYRDTLVTVQPQRLFDFRRLGFTEVKLVISVLIGNQTFSVTELKEGVEVTVFLDAALKGYEGFEIVDINSEEIITSVYDAEAHTITFIVTQLDAYGLTYQMFDIIPVFVIALIIILLITLVVLLIRRKKEDVNEVKTVATEGQKEPEVLEEELKFDAIVLEGVTSRKTFTGGVKVDDGYYLEVTKDFDSTNRILNIEDELLPQVLTSGNAFIKVSKEEAKKLSLKGHSAYGILKKTPGSKGDKGYYAEVDLVNILTGRTIILVEKLPPSSKKGHRWVHVNTRVIK